MRGGIEYLKNIFIREIKNYINFNFKIVLAFTLLESQKVAAVGMDIKLTLCPSIQIHVGKLDGNNKHINVKYILL